MPDAFENEITNTEMVSLRQVRFDPTNSNFAVVFHGANQFRLNLEDIPDKRIAKSPDNMRGMAEYVMAYLASEAWKANGISITRAKTQEAFKAKRQERAETLIRDTE